VTESPHRDSADALSGREAGPSKGWLRGFPWVAAGLAACLAVCCAVLLKITWRAGRELAFFQVSAAETAPLAVPDWIPPEWTAEARAVISRHDGFSIFDDDAIAELCNDLKQLPWVRDVREAERGLPRTLKLAIAPRTPIALVETKNSLILVDAEGTVLPPAYFPASRLENLPRIVKWRGEFAEPDAGARWNDDAVLDGLSVSQRLPDLYFSKLATFAPEFRISRIDVSNVGGVIDRKDSEILLVTTGGVRIKWGRAPRSAKFGELPVESKFKNLARILQDYPGLNGVGAINLRFDEADVFDAQGQWIPRPHLFSQAGR
jgi:hypothetical protein